MSHSHKNRTAPKSKKTEIFIGIIFVIAVTLVGALIGQSLVSARIGILSPTPPPLVGPDTPDVSLLTPIVGANKVTITPSPTRRFNSADETGPTSTPTQTPTVTPTPSPTLDLDSCNATGCGSEAGVLPAVTDNPDLFLRKTIPSRRVCPECPKNETLSEARLNTLIAADSATLARLHDIALSQETYQITPGIVYIVYNNVHHVVIDLKESGYVLRNIIPNTPERGTLITPSYCLSSKSLLVTTADYHGLNGSNKTETGRDLFFHLGRAALYERNGRFQLGVIRTRPAWDRTSISWGGGPIFMWDGQYDYNPEQEWFDAENLDHYRTTRWSKLTAAISKDRKYVFISSSYGLTLREHAQNIIDLGQKWGIKVDRAMRFDGSESAYMAIRLGDFLVPILELEEPLIVNCFAVEKAN